MVWVNEKGRVQSEFSAKGKRSYLSGTEVGAVVGVGRKYYGLKQGGKKVWEHSARQEMKDLLMIEKENQVLYVTRSMAQICVITSNDLAEKTNDTILDKALTKYEELLLKTKKEDTINVEKTDAEKETDEGSGVH